MVESDMRVRINQAGQARVLGEVEQFHALGCLTDGFDRANSSILNNDQAPTHCRISNAIDHRAAADCHSCRCRVRGFLTPQKK